MFALSEPRTTSKTTAKTIEPLRGSDNGTPITQKSFKTDCVVVGILLLMFAPLYLLNAHGFPRQMNTDEISIMSTAKVLATAPGVDIFAPSYYSDLPGFIFWGFGKLGMMLGGVTLGNMRSLHAASGVFIIVLCYLLLRLLALPRYAAFAGTCVVGLNHSLFMISRMAMRDNTALLFMLAALICLVLGWQRKNYGWTLLGGFICGLGFYTYYPGRITIFIWLAFLFLSTLSSARFRWAGWVQAGRLGAVAVIGLLLIATPLFIATSRHVPTDPYASQQFLWQAAAQKQEQQFRGTATVAQAIRMNMVHGLLVFNQPYSDQGMIYPHPGFGFVDKITGVLVWIGVAVVVFGSIARRRLSESDRLALIGFLMIWLSLALLLTRAPDYTRLLIVLPFVGYMVGRAVVGGAEVVRHLRKNKHKVDVSRWIVAAVVILVVAGANGMIVRDFQRSGDVSGDSVGDTLRFQEKHTAADTQWLLVASPSEGYYEWGIPDYWEYWFEFGVGESQTRQVMTPDEFIKGDVDMTTPGAIGYVMTTRAVWERTRDVFSVNRRILEVTPLDKAGNRLAVGYVNL